jgi:beta-1,4-mannosyl-glycoprotein beta-1,4-N-acetylglucosaminyltransferase
MIIDSVIFYNELELLEFRLRMLYDVVDYFVVVEADKTFAGDDKPFYFEASRDRFRWAEDKIVHYKAKLCLDGLMKPERRNYYYHRDSDYFKLEFQHRNAIAQACHIFDNESLLLISDVDEIPSREAINTIKTAKKRLLCRPKTHVCEMQFFYYTLDYLVSNQWLGTVATTVGTMRKVTPQILRNRRKKLPRLLNAGWHLSYFGNADFIANKINSFAHQEFNTDDIKNRNHLTRCIENGISPFSNESFTTVSRDIFPEYFLSLAAFNEQFFFRSQMPS